MRELPHPWQPSATRGLLIGAYLGLLLFAFWLRLPHFIHPALIGSDGAEYVYCVQKQWLPHSPYVVYFWVGWMLDLVAPLDWGYSALSEFSSLLSIPLFGWTLGALLGSRVAGFVGALVLAVTPVCVRYAGIQEVYAFQFLWLALSWWAAVVLKSPLLCGLFLGTGFATHSGTLFAIPTTLFLLQGHLASDQQEDRRGVSGRRHRGNLGLLRSWLRFGGAFAVPITLAAVWLLYLWMVHHGDRMDLYWRYLRGAAPDPRFGELMGEGALSNWKKQFVRTWIDLADADVTGSVLLVLGTLSLVVVPVRRSLPWWLLAVPYLLYEMAIGFTVDLGVYLVFVVPSLAFGIAWQAKRPVENPRSPLAILAGTVALAAVVSVFVHMPSFRESAELRQEMPWIRNEGAPMALCRWVKDNTPSDTLVFQPVDWDPPMMAAALYADRVQIFNDGVVLNPAPWRPFCTDPVFQHVLPVRTQELQKWIREGRPMVGFDPDPFGSWGCFFPQVDASLFEVRPLLWLDRNQSGSSLLWEPGTETIARIDIGNPTDEETYEVVYSASAELATVTIPIFHPCLFYLTEKGADSPPPTWVEELRAKVPEPQRGPLPTVFGDGRGCSVESDGISFKTPAVPGRDHVLRYRMNAIGAEYLFESQVQSEAGWTPVGRDMEKIVVEPVMSFNDFYYRIPAKLVTRDRLAVRIVPIGENKRVNGYDIEVGIEPDRTVEAGR